MEKLRSVNADDATLFYFIPPSIPNVWHGHIYHFFQLQSSGDSEDYDIEPCTYQYPVKCEPVDYFKTSLVDCYTVCCKNSMTINETILVQETLEAAKNGNNYRQVIVHGPTPYARENFKVIYVDSYQLFKKGISYGNGLGNYILNNCNYKHDIDSENININDGMEMMELEWNTSMSYDVIKSSYKRIVENSCSKRNS